jgi:FlaA1/EpsC-like NDP-sugar epimerase
MELANVREENRINRIMQKHRPDFIFHAASYNHSRSVEHFPTEVIMTNVKGTKIMADAAIRHKVRKFILISSNKAVHPTNLMGACKRFAELYTQLLHSVDQTEFMVTRFGNVLGTSNSVVAQFQKQIENGSPVSVAHPGTTRYFMSVNDATALILESAVIGKGGDTFVFDMGQPVNLVELAEKVIKLSGKRPGRDVQISFCGLRHGEKIFEQLIAETEKLTKTSHSGIMKVKGRTVDSRMVDTLIDMIYLTDLPDEAIINRLWEIMPELDGVKPGGALRYMGSPYQQAEDHFQQSKTSI